MAVSDRPLNSPLQIPISRDTPPGMPKELVGTFDDIFNALYLIQVGFVNYTGIAPQDPQFWADLTPDQTILQQNMNRIYLEATEVITFGQMVHINNNAGVPVARLADATDNTRVCSAFCNTASGVGIGDFGEFIIMQGLCSGVGGLTPGTRYFLSETSGGISAGPPVGVGKISQVVGLGLSSNLLYFAPNLQFLQL